MTSWLAFLLLLPLVSALPLEHRANTACGKFDTITSGSYSMLTNHWGESAAISGWQCSTLESIHGPNVEWTTEWTWTGEEHVKSFSNIQLNDGINKQLGEITSMPSTWRWSQSCSDDVVADVAYDLFTSYSPGGSHVNEVMIWLANFNAGPISYEVDSAGQSVPIATNLGIAGHTWDLHLGTNDQNEVYSFLPARGTIPSFSGNIHGFFRYLIDHGHVSSSEYLVTAQAGTEATYGSATLKTLAYTLAIH